MKIDMYKFERSIGIDGDVEHNCVIDFMPDNWFRAEYNTLGTKQIILESGESIEFSKDLIPKVKEAFQKAFDGFTPEHIEARAYQARLDNYEIELDGVWQKNYDRKWAEIRSERDALLKESDFLLWPDYPDLTEEKKAEVTAYRQALRDITDDISDPFEDEVTWPTKPF